MVVGWWWYNVTTWPWWYTGALARSRSGLFTQCSLTRQGRPGPGKCDFSFFIFFLLLLVSLCTFYRAQAVLVPMLAIASLMSAARLWALARTSATTTQHNFGRKKEEREILFSWKNYQFWEFLEGIFQALNQPFGWHTSDLIVDNWIFVFCPLWWICFYV